MTFAYFLFHLPFYIDLPLPISYSYQTGTNAKVYPRTQIWIIHTQKQTHKVKYGGGHAGSRKKVQVGKGLS